VLAGDEFAAERHDVCIRGIDRHVAAAGATTEPDEGQDLMADIEQFLRLDVEVVEWVGEFLDPANEGFVPVVDALTTTNLIRLDEYDIGRQQVGPAWWS
jgi:hypothetical protein